MPTQHRSHVAAAPPRAGLKNHRRLQRDYATAFSATCRAFVQFCRAAGLVKGDLVAIDGSKFTAVTSARRYISTKHHKRDQENWIPA
jgi:hypothetical protein